MTTALRIPGALALAVLLAAWGCSDKEDDGGLTPGSSGGSGGSGGSTVLDAGLGDDGSTAAGGLGGAADDGISSASECAEIVGLPDAQDCGSASVAAEFHTANVMLVVDKSGSMTDTPEGFETDKWGALKDALGQALPEVAGDMNFGMILYPYDTETPIPEDCSLATNCCSVPTGEAAVNVPIAAGPDSVPAILDALDQTFPGGGTPTAVALEAAYQYFTTGAGANLDGERYVLLATDGGPNCNALNTCEQETCTLNIDQHYDASNQCAGVNNGKYCVDDVSVIEQIDLLAAAGVPTFVVGIPGTEQYAPYLSDFAVHGGVPNPDGPPDYYIVEAQGGVQALADTFKSITTHLVRSCDVALTVEPPNPDLVNVAVNCEIVPYEDGAGWEIPDDNRTTLTLKGDTCDWIQSQGANRIDIIYGCGMIR